MGMSPFEIAIRMQLQMPLEVARQKIGLVNPITHIMAVSRQELFNEVLKSLKKATRHMKKYGNRNQRPLDIHVGDQVLLKLTPKIMKKLVIRQERSLIPKFGPFEVI